MPAKCVALFDKFCKYMADPDASQQKLLLLSQTSSMEKCLEKLIVKGLEIPKEVNGSTDLGRSQI
ncbi:hypothetical protein Bca52824_011077 [Brassica carinata]|uniref:Uncharacterized protein n=1 Tax=Brassica carinata TaxID=52824 RepID=A0A8X7WCU5_BRACI|nr:hypothetical protein Bca52824_011077 [Brassica carinata]